MPNRKTPVVGDLVSFRVGQRQLRGRVIEDRGPIGVGGRRLLRIRVGREGEAREYELPAVEVVLAPQPSHRAAG